MLPKILEFTPPVIAHRGARLRAPENTMAAFKAAYEEGARWMETDVKLTSDGVPVLMHDDTLDRTTNGRGAVADMPWAEMKALDTGSWFSPAFAGTHITTLVELLLFARENNVQLNLELKPCPGRARATTMVALIEAHKIWPESAPSPLISSFDIESLKIAAQLQPGWPRGLLLDAWREDWQELATVTQASILNVNAEVLTPERQQMFRQSQTPFLAYTVNDPVRAKSLLQGGAQAVFSDDPAALLQ